MAWILLSNVTCSSSHVAADLFDICGLCPFFILFLSMRLRVFRLSSNFMFDGCHRDSEISNLRSNSVSSKFIKTNKIMMDQIW